MILSVLADVPSWVVTLRDASIAIGAVCGALLTIGAATKLPVVNRPIRWLWRNLVSDPVGGWLRGVLDHHAEPDRERTEQVAAQVAELSGQVAGLAEQASASAERLASVEHEVRTNDGQSLRDVADRVERMTVGLAEKYAPHAVAHRPPVPE